jgi:hypothetical protein
MKHYDYVIYGGGPSGITQALILSKKFKVAIIERKGSLGGCWRVERKNNLFTEHSPKVTSNDYENFVKLMEEVGLNFNEETEPVYPESGFPGIIIYVLKNTSILDMVKILLVYFYYILTGVCQNKTVKEWTENFSEKGKKTIEKMSILISDIPEKVMLEDLISSFSLKTLLKLKDPEKWVDFAEKKLEEKGVDVYYDLEVKSLAFIKGKVINDLHIYGDNHILTMPPLALYQLLSNSDKSVKENWGTEVFDFLLNSYYSSLGFQLHYNKKIKIPGSFCWHCNTGGVAIGYNFENGTVISGTIIDQRNIKNVELTTRKVIVNIIKLLGESPMAITVNKLKLAHPSLVSTIKYDSEDTAFVRTKRGVLEQNGKISMLYTVGSHNEHGASTINKAISISKKFALKEISGQRNPE